MASQHVHGLAEKKAMGIRLRKVIGQLKAVEQMVQDDHDCVDVLTQVISARKALKSFAEVVIREHTQQCIAHASNAREGQRRLRELLVVLERYID
jgi:CsoR family transcriptional regulator, copper-sensing transcriptional repressor